MFTRDVNHRHEQNLRPSKQRALFNFHPAKALQALKSLLTVHADHKTSYTTATMKPYAAILIILFAIIVCGILWFLFGKVVVFKVAEQMASNHEAHVAEVAAAAERAKKRTAKRAAKEEATRIAKEEQALKDAAAMCPNCKVKQGPPSAVSDIAGHMECCERHNRVPHKTVFSVASTESTV